MKKLILVAFSIITIFTLNGQQTTTIVGSSVGSTSIDITSFDLKSGVMDTLKTHTFTKRRLFLESAFDQFNGRYFILVDRSPKAGTFYGYFKELIVFDVNTNQLKTANNFPTNARNIVYDPYENRIIFTLRPKNYNDKNYCLSYDLGTESIDTIASVPHFETKYYFNNAVMLADTGLYVYLQAKERLGGDPLCSIITVDVRNNQGVSIRPLSSSQEYYSNWVVGENKQIFYTDTDYNLNSFDPVTLANTFIANRPQAYEVNIQVQWLTYDAFNNELIVPYIRSDSLGNVLEPFNLSTGNYGQSLDYPGYSYGQELYYQSTIPTRPFDGGFETVYGAEYQWYLNGEPLEANDRLLNPKKSGMYHVEIKDFGGKKLTSKKFWYGEAMTGINELKSNNIIISPNPSAEISTIRLEKPFTGGMQVIDLSGRLIYSTWLTADNQYKLDVSNLERGMYLVQFRYDSGKIITTKLIVK